MFMMGKLLYGNEDNRDENSEEIKKQRNLFPRNQSLVNFATNPNMKKNDNYTFSLCMPIKYMDGPMPKVHEITDSEYSGQQP